MMWQSNREFRMASNVWVSAVVIGDKLTGSILFLGRITNPAG